MLAAAVLLEQDLKAGLSSALCAPAAGAGRAAGEADPHAVRAQVQRIAASFNPQVHQQLAADPTARSAASAPASQAVVQAGRKFRVRTDPGAMEGVRLSETSRSPSMLLTVLGRCSLSPAVSCYACVSQGSSAVYYLVTRGPVFPGAASFLLYAPFLEIDILTEHQALLRCFRGIRRPQTLEERPARLLLNPPCYYPVE